MSNESAFPSGVPLSSKPQFGMSLRDYFAAKALQGELSMQDENNIYDSTGDEVEFLAARCYRFADAMMKARKKK